MAGKTSLPRVAVIGTGGTISSVGRDSLDIATYADNKKKYEVDELLACFGELTGTQVSPALSEYGLAPQPTRSAPPG